MLDQDEALDFYVGTLGFELNTDADLGFMRWLTVNFPGQPDHQLLLERPGPPVHDDATAEQIRELVTKGAMGMVAIIAVDDIHKTYGELVAKGVEFTEEPTERSYGTDCGLRDTFGNHLRIGTPNKARSSRPIDPSSPQKTPPDPEPCRDGESPAADHLLAGMRCLRGAAMSVASRCAETPLSGSPSFCETIHSSGASWYTVTVSV